jgi:hypothetical protein
MPLLPEIVLLSGFAGLPFGSDPEKANAVFGSPDEESVLEDEVFNRPKLLRHYHALELSLFFDLSRNKQFCSAECKHPDTLLFGEKVMGTNEKTLLELLKKHNYTLSDREVLPWGETCLNFDEAGLEAYFENKKLIALSFSEKGH